MDENGLNWPSKRVWKRVESQGKVSEKSVNFEIDIEWQLWLCLYLVQQMLHQIKAQQFHTHFLVLISPLSQSSIFEEELYHFDQYFS